MISAKEALKKTEDPLNIEELKEIDNLLDDIDRQIKLEIQNRNYCCMKWIAYQKNINSKVIEALIIIIRDLGYKVNSATSSNGYNLIIKWS